MLGSMCWAFRGLFLWVIFEKEFKFMKEIEIEAFI